MYTTTVNDYFIRSESIKYYSNKVPLPFEPLFYAIAFVKPTVDHAYIEHRHPAFEIIIPRKGLYQCILNGRKIIITPQEFILIQPGDIHQDIFKPDTEYCAITFKVKDSNLLGKERNLFKKNTNANIQVSSFTEDKMAMELYKLLTSIDAYESIYTYYLLNSVFQAFFWKIMVCFSKNLLIPVFVQSTQNEEFKHLLLNYFERNICNKKHIADMAKELCMSESSLAHKSKKILGITPARAFMNYKMQQAVKLLQHQQMSIKDVSAALGFDDRFHFSKNFKKYFGKTPASFRK
ncbi:MAG: AraC family transcriptional regulator [Victivallaceae bacterium]|nr:AraC family transcriptional regulator [Victivallaceae bacterium]